MRSGFKPTIRSARKLWQVLLPSLLLYASFAGAQGLQISGGLDGRFTNEGENQGETGLYRPQLTGAFLNLRKVWSDGYGDRWIGVAQGDFDDNFRRIRPYQAYVQYKGPLGKWNVLAGHYLLPFGLLATYDTERLVLQGLERTSLGMRKDTGAEAFGRSGSWDYALSASDGLSDRRFVDSRANPVVTARAAYVRGDAQVGFSALIGRVLLDPEFGFTRSDANERRIAVDVTKPFGPLTLRGEAVGGTDNSRGTAGGVLLGDYALTPKLEFNTRYAYWSSAYLNPDNAGHQPGMGFTYQIRQGLFARTAGTYQSRGEDHYGFTLQLYYEFSKAI